MIQAIVYRRLSELVLNFSGKRTPNPESWAKQFFEVLDWGGPNAFKIVRNSRFGFNLFIDRSPVITVVTSPPSDAERVYSALNYSYNRDIPWVVATDFYSLGLFGSYWPSSSLDVNSALALELDHTQYLADSYQLELLTPHAVASSQINELYDSFTGRRKKLPIDQHLVGRMDKWRKLVLDGLPEDLTDGDQTAHRLINALMLVRYLEDTGKNEGTSLKQLLDLTDKQLHRKLSNHLRETDRRTGYRSPSFASIGKVATSALRELINQLYGYPEFGILYDFGAMNVDVLGRFYESYLRQDLVPKQEPKEQQGLFPPPLYEFTDSRRQKGIYYTPTYVVDFLLNSVIERFRAHSPKELPVIADLSVGSGTFLTSAVDHLLEQYPKSSDRVEELANNLVGFDVDERAIEASKLNLTVKLIGQGSSEPIPDLLLTKIDIISTGIERIEKTATPKNGVDIVVGNPPYIAYSVLSQKYDLIEVSQKYETAVGRTDSYIIFVEAVVRILKPGGYAGLVLPNTILRSQPAGRLRKWLSERIDLLEIVDYIEQTIFEGVGAYVCLLIIRKRPAKSVAPDLTVARVYRLSETPATQLAGISAAANPPDGTEVFMVPQPAGNGPWVFRNQVELALLDKLKDQSDEDFADVFELRQGVKTGNDDVFVLESLSQDGEVGRYLNNVSPSEIPIENELLIPVLRNRDIQRWCSRSRSFLLYPYNPLENRPYHWNEIQDRFPKAAEYLSSVQTSLLKRRSLRGKEWFELIEPRLASVYSDTPKLVTSEIAPRPKIGRPFPSNCALVGNAWLARIDDRYDLDVLMAFLNSVVCEWYLRQVSPLLRGGYLLIRQNNFSRMPIPRFMKDRDNFSTTEIRQASLELHNLALESYSKNNPLAHKEIGAKEEKVDALIMGALGLTGPEAEQLRKTTGLARRALL